LLAELAAAEVGQPGQDAVIRVGQAGHRGDIPDHPLADLPAGGVFEDAGALTW
jgi:hypothetical protein